MRRTRSTTHTCRICGRSFKSADVMPCNMLHGPLHEFLHSKAPDWTDAGFICLDDLHRLRREFIEMSMSAESRDLTAMQQQVAASITEHETLAKNLNAEFDSKLSFGDRLADQVAEFGGSWRFIITFGIIIFVWILANALVLVNKGFDPYPFILLNLILSCIASIQAPVIMMSQNRQEAKDRLRSEQDFRTNLKAELEIRTLHAKIDELLTHQWQRLLEIQQIQMEMMEELSAHHAWERERGEAVPAGDDKTRRRDNMAGHENG